MIRIGFQFNFFRGCTILSHQTMFHSISLDNNQVSAKKCSMFFPGILYKESYSRQKKLGCWLKAEYSVTYATNCCLSVINTLGVDI